jgi:hypothetical protein
VAAVIALILHFLHVAESDIILAIVLALLALLLLRDLKAESLGHRLTEDVQGLRAQLSDVQHAVVPPDAVLIGPLSTARVSAQFLGGAHGAEPDGPCESRL